MNSSTAAVELEGVSLIFGGGHPSDEPVLAIHDINIANVPVEITQRHVTNTL